MANRSWGQRAAPLDIDKLNETLKKDRDELKKTLSGFKQASEEFEKGFRHAETEGDNAEMSRLTSELKDSADSLQAENVSDHAEQLQLQINDSKSDAEAGEAIDDCFDDLLDSLDELNQYIDDVLE